MASKVEIPASGVVFHADQIRRCWWCGTDRDYVIYHDDEWGRPISDDTRLFEKLCLEGFQAGLSWLTILRKRQAFRAQFCGFDFRKVAQFDSDKVERLLQDPNIVRHKGKINSVINNARQTLEMLDEHGSLAAFIWQFEPRQNAKRRRMEDIPSQTEESRRLSKALKQSGWTFVGPTTCYAFMQSVGLVNDHLVECDCWDKIERLRTTFTRP